MKNVSTIPCLLAALLVAAGCANKGDRGQDQAAAGGTPGEAHAVVAEPGAQGSQAPTLVQQGAEPGPGQAWGLPGATASQAGGAPNIGAGQQLAASGSPSGVAACVGCHGAQGEGNAAGGFPRIAGQPANYLGKQLAAYANGARVNPIMEPIAKAMNAQQIRDVSAYYAQLGEAGAPGQQTPPASPGATGPAERGRVLAQVGDNRKRVQACANCHGPGGAGEPPNYPYLAGQHASYLNASMGAWKSGARKTDQSGQMTHVAQIMSDADVAAVAAYFSAQPAPAPAAKMVNIAAGTSARPAVAAEAGAPGPRGPAATTVTGAGTEQGAPSTGGAQGPGGGGGTQGTQPQQQQQQPQQPQQQAPVGR